jgi:ankyrin repeat protein
MDVAACANSQSSPGAQRSDPSFGEWNFVQRPGGRGPRRLADVANTGDVGAVEALLEGGKPPDEPGEGGTTALHEACNTGHGGMRIVSLLLRAGATPNSLDRQGETALHMAADARNSQAAKLLLEHGWDPALASTRGRTALHKVSEAAFHSETQSPYKLYRIYGFGTAALD